MNTFIQQGCIKCLSLASIISEIFIMLQKVLISNKYCPFELSICQRIQKTKSITVFNI